MKVEIWSDVICPFCYIGKRNFETALSQFENRNELEIIWKSFLLDPTISEVATENYTNYLIKRKGMAAAQVEGMLANVTAMASEVGLDYHLEKSILVNSTKAHQLIQFAKSKNLGDAAEEHLFSAFFIEGKNIGDIPTLIELGKSIGLDENELKSSFTDEKYAAAMEQDIQEAQSVGVSGVPFFVFNRKYAVSGAQPAEAFLETLNKSFVEWTATQNKPTLEVSKGNSCSVDGVCE